MIPKLLREMVCEVQGCVYGPCHDCDGNPVCLRCGAVEGGDEGETHTEAVEGYERWARKVTAKRSPSHGI